MTTQEIAQMIAEVEIPFAYYQFEEGTAEPCPFICFYYSNNDDVIADNLNYVKVANLVIELYTNYKDIALENKIEGILNAHEIVYSKNESYIDNEKMLMQVYESEVIING